MAHIRVESHQKVVTDAKVFYVDGDTEIDISKCVQVVDVHLAVGELATVTLSAVLGGASLTADLKEIIDGRPLKAVAA